MQPLILTAAGYTYLWFMRLLVSFILSCFFFGAPLVSSAGDMPKHRIDKVNGSISKAGLLQKLFSNDCPAVITTPVSSSTYSARYKFFSLTNFINTSYSINNTTALPVKKYFSHPYLYCKPIGMKLLFPKHYFW